MNRLLLRTLAWLRSRRFRRWLGGLLLAVVLIIALISSLVSTQAGSRWLVKHLATAAHVQLGDMQGNLLTGLDIRGVDYSRDEVHIQADRLVFHWQPMALLYTAVSVQSVQVDNLKIALPATNAPTPDPYPWPSLAQPLRVELNHIQVNHLQVTQGQEHWQLERLSGSVSLGTFHLRLKDIQLAAAPWQLVLDGTMGLRYPYGLAMDSRWQWQAEGATAPLLMGKATWGGDITHLTVKHQLQQPLQVTTTGTIAPALYNPHQAPHVQLTSQWQEQPLPEAWKVFFAQLPVSRLQTLGTVQGKLALTGWWDKSTLDAELSGATRDGRLGVKAKADIYQGQLLQLQQLQLQVMPEGVEAASYPQLTLRGRLERNPWRWDMQLQGEHFNIADIVDDWPSDLQLRGGIKGAYGAADGRWHWQFPGIDAQGEVRNLNLSARGEVHYEQGLWGSHDLALIMGANQLQLKGQLGEQLDLQWKINAPLLNQIDPNLGGSVVSDGVLSGDPQQPKVRANASIQQLVWRDLALESLQLTLAPEAANSENYRLELTADHLQWQSQRLAHLRLKGAGSLQAHSLDASAESPDYGKLELGLSGTWRDHQWRGAWRKLNLDAKRLAPLYLSSSAPVTWEAAKASLGRVCLSSSISRPLDTASSLAPGALPHSDASAMLLQKLQGSGVQASGLSVQEKPSLCLAGSWQPNTGTQAEMRMLAIPASLFQQWFKTDAVPQGVLDGQLNLCARPAQPVQLDAHVQARDVQIAYQFQGGNTEVYPLTRGTFDLALANQQLSASLLTDWGKYGSLSAEGKLNTRDQRLQGHLVLALNDLAPLESLLPFLNDVQGSANGDLSLAGTWNQPQIQGNLSLNQGRANLPRLGLSLKDIAIHMASQSPDNIQVDAQATSGDGTLMVKGALLNPGAADWSWHSNIYGANIRVVELSQITATISPNLQLAANAQAIRLTGSTEIPWARVALKTLPESATKVSSDAVVIESKSLLPASATAPSSLPFYTNVNLYFGEDARFKGFGLDSQLTGKINVLKEANRQTLTTGFVAVGQGKYKAYGQELNIERGRLIFQGPYDNPGLDIRALRVMDTVTAGLEIGGTLQHPKSTVFSIPASSDSEAMAVLLTGKPLSQSSQADAYSIIGAIGSLGMDRGQMMTADIAHLFRLDEITIKSDKGLEQSALWMGKYVTPRLFIRYAVGLFDQAFTLGMRYQLSDKLRLEAESGKNQSLDVVYKIER